MSERELMNRREARRQCRQELEVRKRADELHDVTDEHTGDGPTCRQQGEREPGNASTKSERLCPRAMGRSLRELAANDVICRRDALRVERERRALLRGALGRRRVLRRRHARFSASAAIAIQHECANELEQRRGWPGGGSRQPRRCRAGRPSVPVSREHLRALRYRKLPGSTLGRIPSQPTSRISGRRLSRPRPRCSTLARREEGARCRKPQRRKPAPQRNTRRPLPARVERREHRPDRVQRGRLRSRAPRRRYVVKVAQSARARGGRGAGAALRVVRRAWRRRLGCLRRDRRREVPRRQSHEATCAAELPRARGSRHAALHTR
jgi:hypothetical protein